MYQTGVRNLKVPCWPELATAKIWRQAIQFPGFRDYMPDNWCGDVRTERPFFYGVLTTLCPDFVTTLIKDCRTMRKAQRDSIKVERPLTGVKISKEWVGRLLEE
jgi:hypothetical protein